MSDSSTFFSIGLKAPTEAETVTCTLYFHIYTCVGSGKGHEHIYTRVWFRKGHGT